MSALVDAVAFRKIRAMAFAWCEGAGWALLCHGTEDKWGDKFYRYEASRGGETLTDDSWEELLAQVFDACKPEVNKAFGPEVGK